MASGADAISIPVIEREEGVVTSGQRRRDPGGRRVACGTCSGPARRYVIRIRGPSEVCLVAAIACRWRTRKDIVDVALDAIHRGVCAGQREWRVVVVEGRPGPGGCGVARVAGRGEARRRVHGISRPIPIRGMAAIAGRRQ